MAKISNIIQRNVVENYLAERPKREAPPYRRNAPKTHEGLTLVREILRVMNYDWSRNRKVFVAAKKACKAGKLGKFIESCGDWYANRTEVETWLDSYEWRSGHRKIQMVEKNELPPAKKMVKKISHT